jgi:hypothetical protein
MVIFETSHEKFEDLSSLKDSEKEFELYDIQVSYYCGLYIDIYFFL